LLPTVSYIQSCFDEYNARFFGGSLPPVPIRLSHAKGFLGKVTFTRRKQGLFRGYKNENFVLRINARIDLPEELIRDTILHEMIHYFIAVNQLTDTSTHGRLFRREMARINAEGNRHISISHRLTDEQRAQSIIHKTRAIAIVRFTDGQTGIKIVPNTPQHIQYWHRKALRTFNKPLLSTSRPQIASITWFLSSDDYFARFPSSIAMKIQLVADPSEIPLSSATPLPD
jgi:hypothetical protein